MPYADHQSHGDIIQTVRTDVTQMRMVVQAVARMFLEGAVVVGLLAIATSMSPSLAMWVLLVLPVVIVADFFGRATTPSSLVYRPQRQGMSCLT